MENIDIRVKYFDPACKLEKIEQGDWIDLRAAQDVFIRQGETCCIPLGVAMELPEGYEAHIAPRSSTCAKWGIIQTNSVGVIDNSYCGDNDQWAMPVYAIRDAIISKGDRICQFRIVKKQPRLHFHEVELLGNPDRGGFGSTGAR